MDLTGQWEFRQCPEGQISDLSNNGWFRASVPNSVFNNLIENEQINRTDINANPERFSWVSEKPTKKHLTYQKNYTNLTRLT
jgi:hypothetical protein